MLMSTHVHSFDLLNLFKFGMGDLKQLLLRHLFRLAVRRIGSIRKARGGLFGIVFPVSLDLSLQFGVLHPMDLSDPHDLADLGGIGELVSELEAQLSQESAEAEEAEACRSHSDSEIDEEPLDLEPNQTPWWVSSLQRHTQHLGHPECQTRGPVKVLSACTGACAEGHVLQVTCLCQDSI